MLSGVNQGRVGFYSTKSGSCPQLKVYSWGDNHFAFSYHRIVELHSSRNVCSGSGQATKISTALVVYISTCGGACFGASATFSAVTVFAASDPVK